MQGGAVMVELDGIICGDCRDVLKQFPDNYFHAVVTDPPYELTSSKNGKTGFMGKAWDGSGVAFDVNLWAEVLRVLRPGGYLLAFGGSRTYHRMACAIEDAGFVVHPLIAWVQGQGFPKATNLGKQFDRQRHDDIRPVCRFLRDAINSCNLSVKSIAENFGFHPRMVEHWAARDSDSQPSIPTWDQWLALKALLKLSDEMDAEVWRLNGRKGKPGEAWAEREVIGKDRSGKTAIWNEKGELGEFDITAPASPEAIQWDGWYYGRQSLKPAIEPIGMFQKPPEGRMVDSVRKWGVGAVNVDASRIIPTGESLRGGASDGSSYNKCHEGWDRPWKNDPELQKAAKIRSNANQDKSERLGRWPANFILSHAPGCKRVGSRKVKGQPAKDSRSEIEDKGCYGTGRISGLGGYADPTGHETIDAWECVEGCPVKMLDEQSGISAKSEFRVNWEVNRTKPDQFFTGKRSDFNKQSPASYGDQGTASRFFLQVEPDPFYYCAKADPGERGGSNHPTMKPLELMRYLCRLVTPPEGIILDPFTGSGTTCLAARLECFHYVGIEQSAEYCEIVRKRIAAVPRRLDSFFRPPEEDARP